MRHRHDDTSCIICCLDTFAMVKIWEKLKDTAKEMP